MRSTLISWVTRLLRRFTGAPKPIPPEPPQFFAQQQPSTCAVACLRMILSCYRFEIAENELARLCGANEFGTELPAKKAMIHVIATVDLKSGKREEFLAEFQRVVPLVRGEAGCLEYGPAIDVPTGLPAQGPIRDDVVVIVEKWDSREALRAHLVAPHMHEYRGRVKDLVEKVQLQVLEPA